MDQILESGVEGAQKQPLDPLGVNHKYGDDAWNDVDLVGHRHSAHCPAGRPARSNHGRVLRLN